MNAKLYLFVISIYTRLEYAYMNFLNKRYDMVLSYR